MLAYGSTIHKAQGATYEGGVLDIGTSEGKHPGRTYTAFSRFTDSLGFYCAVVPTLDRLRWAKGIDAKRALETRRKHEAALEQTAFQTILKHASACHNALTAALQVYVFNAEGAVVLREGWPVLDAACAWALLCTSMLSGDVDCFIPLFWGPKKANFKKAGRAVALGDALVWFVRVHRARRELIFLRKSRTVDKATQTMAWKVWAQTKKAELTHAAALSLTKRTTLQEQWTKKSAELGAERDQLERDKALVKKMRAYNGAGFFDLDRNKKDDDDADYDSDTTDGHMAVHQGSNVHHFDSNMTSLTAEYGLIPFPGFVHAEGDVTWSLPDGVTISFDLFDYYSNSRLSKNWEIIKRWLMMHGAHVTLHYATGNKFQIGCSCGIVAARILTWIVQNHGAIPSNTNEAVLSSVLKAANTVLYNAGLLHSSFAGTNKTKFLSETSVHMLACDYMKTEADMDPPPHDPLSQWPFSCTTIDQLLVQIARRLVAAKTKAQGGSFYFCTNTEATGHGGFHWVACKLTVTISEAFRASVAVDSDDEVSL